MSEIIFAAGIAMAVSILLTPWLVRIFSRQGFGQEIRVDGPQSHQAKRGTPSMGGVAIVAAIWLGYFGSHLFGSAFHLPPVSVSALIVLFLVTVLAVVGFLDDFIKLRKRRNLGLTKSAKLIGQLVASLTFSWLVLQFPDRLGRTPGTVNLSYVRDFTTISFGALAFVVFCFLLVSAWSNAVNFTDGLDGLAAGSMAMALATYTVISVWQYQNACGRVAATGCYDVRDPMDLAVLAAAGAGACVGFLWWNTAPAKIFMGDTGSLSLGGFLAGLSVTTQTELLMVVIGALFVAEAASVVIQIAVFRTTGRRAFRMAPFHHHFELAGWRETTVIVRFWILAALSSAAGLALFYAEWVSHAHA
ncbi:phospho-N-acetylmuramoyl-pentapeptide-transferas e [Segniliparus rotundus DSM 44985]|uniref:Phospho-N-acetylmuramoyl-pentapeptide-transferase n=1 Tax=Segniliparus rotundus (strain ATCC BAA-972 / CDC 1076 / CIP 108378 / DSM 44985 / JCM 13578) TaxID=640132 RepID=D6ZC51_SEGRD|nr:phospho-N-acetylmuramoyl-pentapeptide-transferase [Segniliparus rotundus]ADG99020.1 phospho-N-acetylmuramoyl-pentapeptide-transferas e [Segniliparus rotundus DSM 44985]